MCSALNTILYLLTSSHRKYLMATADPFSPEIMKRLTEKENFITKATKAVSEFSKFPGPDGLYYARLVKIRPMIDKKKNYPIFKAYFMVIASVENNSTEFGGNTVNFGVHLKATENQTEGEAWDRLFVSLYQCLGCITASWAEKGNIMEVLKAETLRLNEEKPACTLMIVQNQKDPRFHNVNIRDHLTLQAISHFTTPDLNISDTTLELTEAPDQTIIEESIVADFKEQFAKAETMIRGVQDLEALKSHLTKIEYPLSPEIVELCTMKQLQDTILISYLQTQGHDPKSFGLVPVDAGDVLIASQVAKTSEALTSKIVDVVTVPFDVGAALADAIIEEDDDPVNETPYEKAFKHCLTLDREEVKRQTVKLNPTTKFSKSTETLQLQKDLALLMS